MAKKHYAWSHIRMHDGKKLQTLPPGTEVDAEKLGMDEDGFKELVESGSVRTTKWPEGLDPKNPNALSPNQHRLQQLRQQREQVEADMYATGGEATSEEENNPPANNEGNK